MTPALRHRVRQRADDCCEYCGLPQAYTSHFEWRGPILLGKTTGRATLDLLQINLAECIEHRRLLIEAGLFGRER